MPGPVVGRAEVDVHADLSPFRRELVTAAAIAGRQYGDTLATSLDQRLRRTTRVFDRFWGSQLRGSRNDFLNFVGIVSAGVERLVGNVLGRGLGLIATGFENLGNVIARFPSLVEFAGGFRLIGDNIRGLGAGGIDGLLIQLIALGLAFTGGAALAGLFAAAISTVTAGITALAVGIGGALLGGLTALAPIMGAVVVAAAALSLGFSDLSDAQQDAFGPLSDLLDELRAGVQETLFSDLGDQVNGLVTAFRPLGGVLNGVAAAFRDWVSQVIGEIGPGGPLAGSLSDLGESIPGTFARLLDILSNLGGSLVGLFDAATPAANRLLDSINGVLGQFNTWVNSVEGQEAIDTFLQQAIDLLNTLFDIASEVGGVLGTLWQEGGADAAQDLLDGLQEIVDVFGEWLSSAEGRDALLQWFQDGVAALESLGLVLSSIIFLIDALDTSFTRQGFIDFTNFVSGNILALGALITIVQDVTTAVVDFVTGLLNTLNEIGSLGTVAAESGQEFRSQLTQAFTAVGEAIGNVATAIGGALGRIVTNISDTVSRWNAQLDQAIAGALRLRDQAIAAFNRLVASIGAALVQGVASVVNFRNRAVDAFTRFATDTGRAVGNVVNAIGRLPGQIGAALGRFVNNIINAVTRGVTAFRNFATQAVDAIASLPGRFARFGAEIIQGLYDGIVSRGSSVLSYLRNLAAEAAAVFADILGIASPSKVFAQFGEDIVQGLVNGIESSLDLAADAANSLAGAATLGNLNTPVGQLADQGSAGFGGATTSNRTDVGGITVVTPHADPRLVAIEVMDALASQGK